MGGKSSSGFTIDTDPSDQSKYVNYKGATNLDGGGFCSLRAKDAQTPFDLSGFDGICVSMKSAVNFKYKFYVNDAPFSYQ